MAHVVVEYSANLADRTDIAQLLASINAVLRDLRDEAEKPVFPLGGLRSRAIGYHDYCIADGKADYAFMHISLKMGAGRTEDVQRRAAEAVFGAARAQLADLFERHLIALSLELICFSEAGTLKMNNLHAYLAGADRPVPTGQ